MKACTLFEIWKSPSIFLTAIIRAANSVTPSEFNIVSAKISLLRKLLKLASMHAAERFIRAVKMGGQAFLFDVSRSGQRPLTPIVAVSCQDPVDRHQLKRNNTSLASISSTLRPMPVDPHALTEAYEPFRMGSLAGRAKILSEDRADQDVESEASASTTVIAVSCAVEQPQQGRSISYRVGLPSTRLGLLERCRYELAAMPPMITRSFLESDQAQHIAVPDTIRVMQWNILAQSLAEKSDKFICPDEALNWNYRRWRILEEVLTYGADIICLQEVDHFNFLKATLGRVGFEGCFFPKPDSPCCYIKGNNGPDGCAVFFDSSKYTLLHTERKVLEVFRCQSNQVVIMCTFERKLDSKVFCVATTHLKARVGALLPTLRNEQGKDLLQFVQSHNTNDYPVIYAGDFNAEPTEPVYRTMTQSGNLSSSYAMVASRSSATSATTAATTPVVDNDGNNVCDSASNEPQYTTWKIREDGEVCHTIDYIFFSKDRFNPERVLTMPSDEELGKGRAPSLQYASDHFSLCCDFRLL